MAKNSNMIAAKKAKNDEFYTQLPDISAELTHDEYLEAFKNKWIYCNCDNPEISQFFTFFCLNFVRLGLRGLTCTYLAGTSGSKDPVAYRFDVWGDSNGDGIIDNDDIIQTKLLGNGSFDSPECLEILEACDIVVTNPPFSLFRPYFLTLINYNKKFAIMANTNAITNKDVFPLVRDNKIWPGYGFNKTMEFMVPEGYKFNREENGIKYGSVPAIMWLTNIDLNKRHQKLLLYKNYDPEIHQVYDNYCAINVNKIVDIPVESDIELEIADEDLPKWQSVYGSDLTIISQGGGRTVIRVYNPVLGVPITFLNYQTPEQFSIIGLASRHSYTNYKEELKSIGFNPNIDSKGGLGIGVVEGKVLYDRLLIRRK